MQGIGTERIVDYMKKGIKMAIFAMSSMLFIAGVIFFVFEAIFKITSDDEPVIYLVSDSLSDFVMMTDVVRYPEGIIYYESLQKSVEDFWILDDIKSPVPTEDDEIILLGKNTLFSVRVGKNFILGPNLWCILVENKNGLYSGPLYCWSQPVLKTFSKKEMTSEEDKVAFNLIMSYSHREATMQANAGLPIFYGVGTDEKANHLSIMGRKPDEIFSYTYDGDTYYFWYYLDGSEFVEHFNEYYDLEQMTAEDAVTYFEIRFD